MPSYSGIWTLSQQFQGQGQGLWPRLPGAPTIGTATLGSGFTASVAFTAPACAGVPATLTYTATSTPGCITATGSSSPVTVSGLTDGTSYTFKVKAQNGGGFGPCSAASNSITVVNTGQDAYTTAGTFSWVAPAGVTSVSVVAVGGGGGGGWGGGYSGGGGALAYNNNISVTPGSSYAVVVGSGGTGGTGYPASGNAGGQSYFINTSTARAGGGPINGSNSTYTGAGGGSGGAGTQGGGGAGGYAGIGGIGGGNGGGSGGAGTGGGGGGGAGGFFNTDGVFYDQWGTSGSGGGVGILGQGANGAGATYNGNPIPGGGGSGGTTPSQPGSTSNAAPGGVYGGGGGAGYQYLDVCGGSDSRIAGTGGVGAVRIIWPGTTRSFPSTNTGNV